MPVAFWGDTWDLKKRGVWASCKQDCRGMLSLSSMGQQLHTFVTHHKDLVVALIFHHLYPVILEPEMPLEGTPRQGQSFPLAPSPHPLSFSLLPHFLHTAAPRFT